MITEYRGYKEMGIKKKIREFMTKKKENNIITKVKTSYLSDR